MNNSVARDIRLIVSDLDGTLLSSAGTLSPLAVQASRELRARGLRLSVASGRTDFMMRSFIRQLGISDPVISCNGALIRDCDTGTIVHQDVFDEKTAVEMLDCCRTIGADYMAYTAYETFFAPDSLRKQKFERYNRIAAESGDQPMKLLTFGSDHKPIARDGVSKVLVCRKREGDLECVEEFLRTKQVECMPSEPGLLDIMPERASKGNALRRLAEHLEIPLQSVCVFGDFCNDVSMMRLAGFSVAVANACDEVKAVADVICATNDENGVANAIYEYLL